MTKLQVGQYVRVRRPKSDWRYVHPNFVKEMDRFVGQVLTVVSMGYSFEGDKVIYLEGTPGIERYQWRLEWLDASLSDNIQNGDLL